MAITAMRRAIIGHMANHTSMEFLAISIATTAHRVTPAGITDLMA
jgi:hypothetical protein